MDASKSLAKRTVAVEPGDGVLDNPPARQEFKFPGGVGAPNDLQGPVAELGERPAQAWRRHRRHRQRYGAGASQSGEQRWGAVAILDVGGMDDGGDEKACRVGQEVTLASLDLLAGTIPAGATRLGRLHRLAVDDAGRGARLARHHLASEHHQGVVDALLGAVVAPAVEVILHHCPQRRLSRPAARRLCRHIGRDHRPLLFGRVSCIARQSHR